MLNIQEYAKPNLKKIVCGFDVFFLAVAEVWEKCAAFFCVLTEVCSIINFPWLLYF